MFQNIFFKKYIKIIYFLKFMFHINILKLFKNIKALILSVHTNSKCVLYYIDIHIIISIVLYIFMSTNICIQLHVLP